ncbi:MAG: hypothetical protein IH629_00480 [Thermoleophilia bacterium]|nr:hypothetical protein [Thermoleophilia bacterium]
MPTDQDVLELRKGLTARIELVNSDPEDQGGQATVGDQFLHASVGLIRPPAEGRPMRLSPRHSVGSAPVWSWTSNHRGAR